MAPLSGLSRLFATMDRIDRLSDGLVPDDSHYLEPPDDERERWCAEHQCKQPCQACRYEERD